MTDSGVARCDRLADSCNGDVEMLVNASPAEGPESDPELAVMFRNGIVRTQAFRCQVDGNLYSNLKDALAQVARSPREQGA